MKNVLLCRIYQSVMYVAMFFLPWRTPTLLSGKGAFSELPKKIKNDGFKTVLIVTDKGLMSLNMLDPLFESLKNENVAYALFDEVVPNPTIHNVEAALKVYNESGGEAIIAVGGGSPMDLAKAVGARVAKPNKSLQKMGGVLKIMKKTPTLYAVPTTSGTGSETTLAAVITDSDKNFKYAINDPSLIPDIAVLDPLLTVKLPPHITSTTGMDALCHAVEAYIGRANTKSTKQNAKEAIVLIKNNLKKAYDDGENIEARENMQHASFLAGLAFTRAYVGYVHAIAHSLGGKYHIPHGLANAVVMPYVFETYGENAHKKLAELADLIEITNVNDSQEVKAQKFIDWIRDMNASMNIKDGFSEINEDDIPEMASHAIKEGNPLYPVPKIFDKAAFEAIYRKLMR